jgi:hypothetical protein
MDSFEIQDTELDLFQIHPNLKHFTNLRFGLGLFYFGFFILACFDGPYITAQIPALVPIFIMSFGLVSCILMEKVTLDYWKWKEEKIGRFLFGLCASISLVSSLVAVFICIT